MEMISKHFKVLSVSVLMLTLSLPVQPHAIVGWGDNEFGQATPPAGNDFVAIAAGGSHSLALTLEGKVLGWGRNNAGQINIPDMNNVDVVAIAAGEYHSLALTAQGTIVGWGRDIYGQATPPDYDDFIAVAAAASYSVGLRADGTLVQWGSMAYDSPPTEKNFRKIASGATANHALALNADRYVVCWGLNTSNQADDPSGNDYIAIATGGMHSLALRMDGSLHGWGDNIGGQISVPSGTNFTAIAAGSMHSIALTEEGAILGWGNNDFGQTNTPEGASFVAIAAGGNHNLALSAVPMSRVLTYQGRLMESGNPAQGQYDVQFKLYSTPTGGNPLGREVTLHNIDVTNGYLNAKLDFGNDKPLFSGSPRWIEIGIRAGQLDDPELFTWLSPRQEVTPAAYAQTASVAQGLNGKNGAAYAVYVHDSGYIGIGTMTPQAELDVAGNISADNIWVKIADIDLVNSTGYTLSGLNGDRQKMYKILFQGTVSAGGSDKRFLIRINNITSDYRSYCVWDGDANGSEWNTTAFLAGRSAWSQNGDFILEYTISAMTGRKRLGFGESTFVSNSGSVLGFGRMSGACYDTEGNITSLWFGPNGGSVSGKLMVFSFR
ncbi:MAG: hypothetical protein ABFD91_01235 [Anaerohalosphaeraceae bacterium]